MRKNLEVCNGDRLRFEGVVSRFGWKNGYKGPLRTLLLRDVVFVEDGRDATGHLWFTCGKWSEELGVGDRIRFDARIDEYEKGYKGWREDVWDAPVERDYRLVRPTKIEKVTEGVEVIEGVEVTEGVVGGVVGKD